MIERMLSDHKRLRGAADALERLLLSPDRPEPEALAAARWTLGSTMMQHLAFEDRHLYAHLERDPRETVRRAGTAFREELASTFAPYIEHAKGWTPERVAAAWDEYREQALALIAGLRVRMDREEAELYPLVRRHGIDTKQSALHDRNWTHEAFAIKQSIGG